MGIQHSARYCEAKLVAAMMGMAPPPKDEVRPPPNSIPLSPPPANTSLIDPPPPMPRVVSLPNSPSMLLPDLGRSSVHSTVQPQCFRRPLRLAMAAAPHNPSDGSRAIRRKTCREPRAPAPFRSVRRTALDARDWCECAVGPEHCRRSRDCSRRPTSTPTPPLLLNHHHLRDRREFQLFPTVVDKCPKMAPAWEARKWN